MKTIESFSLGKFASPRHLFVKKQKLLLLLRKVKNGPPGRANLLVKSRLKSCCTVG